MERSKPSRIPTAILTSDWHLREDTPTCFTGDFQKEQWDAVEFIRALQAQYDCIVIHAGDLFHHWKPSPWLLTKTMIHMPHKFYTIYGQHDLPQHNLDLCDKTGIYNLWQADKLEVCMGVHWGQTPNKNIPYCIPDDNFENVLVWHHLTYLKPPFPGAEGGMAEGILRKYPQYDLIVTGDCHQSFTVEHQGRRLVNPGNLTRQVADQIDFQPAVYLWYAEDNSVKRIPLPIQSGVISREHIDIKEKRNERIDAFVSKLNDDYQTDISFEKNLERFFESNTIKESVKNIVFKAIDV
jgi:predicted phosphodiesterase